MRSGVMQAPRTAVLCAAAPLRRGVVFARLRKPQPAPLRLHHSARFLRPQPRQERIFISAATQAPNEGNSSGAEGESDSDKPAPQPAAAGEPDKDKRADSQEDGGRNTLQGIPAWVANVLQPRKARNTSHR